MRMKFSNKQLQAFIISLGIGLGAVSGAAFPLAAAAASPEFARSQEEWEHLRDNTLEWYEIPDLVIEYNPSVQKNRAELEKDERRSMDAREVTDWLLSEADDYDYLADTAATGMEGAGYRIMANQLRSQADSNVTDYEILKLQNELLEKQTIRTVQNLYLNYYKAISTRDSGSSGIAYLERMAAAAEHRRNVGMATALDVLAAQESLSNARAEAVTNEANIGTYRTNLITMCGWAYDAAAEIAPVPEVDPGFTDSISVEEDMAQAQAQSYTLRIDQRKLDNARAEYPNLVKQYEDQLKSDTDSFKVSFRGVYDQLIAARFAYTNAVSALQLQQQEVAKGERQYQLGLISLNEFEGIRNQYVSLDNSCRAAYLDMLSAKAAYEMAKEGVI